MLIGKNKKYKVGGESRKLFGGLGGGGGGGGEKGEMMMWMKAMYAQSLPSALIPTENTLQYLTS